MNHPDTPSDARYTIAACPADFAPVADWDHPVWQQVPALSIDHYPWPDSGHRPTTQAKLQYTAQRLYVIFRVADQYVRSVETCWGGPVSRGSCVEFFFSPSPAESPFYFNVEVNCGGTVLFHGQSARGRDVVRIDRREAESLQVAHTLPSVVDPELTEPTVWSVAYGIPFKLLRQHAAVTGPADGVVWRANLYKCAETNSHPHWGCWSPIDTPDPDFHRPEYFAPIVFA